MREKPGEKMDKLYKIIGKHVGLKPEEITDDLSYESTEKWDSFTHLSMVSDIEKEFHVEFDVDEITGMENVAKIKEYLKKHGMSE
jgi:acyl carrier protein